MISFLFERLVLKKSAMEIGPILPANIKTVIISLPALDNDEVMYPYIAKSIEFLKTLDFEF